MGMFDYSDPEIALAAGLLSGRGNLGGIMGRSLMDAQRAYLATSEDKRRNKQAEMQEQQMRMALEQAEQERQQRRKMDEFRSRIPMPGVGPDGMGPPNASQADLLSHEAVRAGFGDPIAYINSLRKDKAPIKLGAGESLLDPNNFQPLATNPKEGSEDRDVSLLKLIHGDGTPQFFAALKQLETKRTTHQPASQQVNYGSNTVPVQNPDGTIGLLQLGNRADAPPKVVVHPGTGKPAIQPKPVPSASTQKDIAENNVALQKIDAAIKLLDKNPGSVGLQNYLGDTVMQRADPLGVETRAAIADIGSQKIHDRSGAAVTAAEAPRLKPFVPLATDTKASVAIKLKRFREEYEAMNRALTGGASITDAAKQTSPKRTDAPTGFRILEE
jgi:hypothetical protein